MGAGKALAGFQLRPVMALQMRLQIFRQLRHRGKGIRHGGNRLIRQGKFLGTAGKLAVIFCRCLAQALEESGPVGNQQRAHLAQPGIILRQDLQQGRILKPVLQNPTLLLQNPVVLRQRRIVIGPQLAQGMVAKPPPLGCAHFQDHQILGAKQHRGQYAIDIRQGLFLGAIAPDLPGTTPVKQHPTQALLAFLRKYFSGNFRKIRPKPQHFSGFLGPEAFSAAKIGNRFQKIGLSLGIIAHDQVYTGIKGQIQGCIIAEIP